MNRVFPKKNRVLSVTVIDLKIQNLISYHIKSVTFITCHFNSIKFNLFCENRFFHDFEYLAAHL
jgi:hypothetical protein